MDLEYIEWVSKQCDALGSIKAFVLESNLIEGIKRDPTDGEIKEMHRFLDLDKITTMEMCRFVAAYQPDARLREYSGMNVQVGNHMPLPGGPVVSQLLMELLFEVGTSDITPYEAHVRYETLHAYMDCNGRSGRALWLWQMTRNGDDVPLGFLHTWYYQSLGGARK